MTNSTVGDGECVLAEHLTEFRMTCFATAGVFSLFAYIEYCILVKFRDRDEGNFHRNKARVTVACFAGLLTGAFYLVCGILPNGHDFFCGNETWIVLLLSLFYHVCRFFFMFGIMVDNLLPGTSRDVFFLVLPFYSMLEGGYLLLYLVFSRAVAEVFRSIIIFLPFTICACLVFLDERKFLFATRPEFDFGEIFQRTMMLAFVSFHWFIQFISLKTTITQFAGPALFGAPQVDDGFSITTVTNNASECVPYFLFTLLFYIKTRIFFNDNNGH